MSDYEIVGWALFISMNAWLAIHSSIELAKRIRLNRTRLNHTRKDVP